jgi:chitodextrinase
MANEAAFKVGDQVKEKVNARHILVVERIEGDQVHVSWKQGKEKAVFQASALEKFADYTGPTQSVS